jgi:hypothetical protein
MARKTWGQLSPAYRTRLARAFGKDGLSRKQTRERYNRGTLGPVTGARGHSQTPERPSRAERNPQKYQEYIARREPQQIAQPESKISKRVQALRHIRTKLGNFYKYNDKVVVANVNLMSSSELDWTIGATTEQLRSRASIQHAGQVPWWTSGETNHWWYH